MAGPIKDAADATDRAMEFLKRHYIHAVPIKAEQKVLEWNVDADVGYTRTIIIRVALNLLSGEIIRYERVEG